MNRILIVEDDVFVSRMYGRAFNAANFETDTASDGVMALEKLSHDPLPSVIMMDVRMPKMGGAELLSKIKSDSRLSNIPIAVLTNSFVSEDEKKFMKLGADIYLIKVENLPQAVVQKMQDLIRRKRTN